MSPVAVDVREVERLLGLSKVAHLQYQAEQRKPGANYRVCEQHVAEALKWREAASGLDPSHTAPIWGTDDAKWPHATLLQFYADYPRRP